MIRPMEQRSTLPDRLSNVADQTFDVVVIGGGIVGASSAREAASAGYSVLLAEKDDFAAGSTSRSSRLLHCGLRYFEAPNPVRYFASHPGRFLTSLRMARQAMLARHEIVTTSAARATPLDFHFPIFRDGPYKPWQTDVAFRLLGSLAPKDVPLDYANLSREQALKNPLVAALANTDALLSVARFTEYQFDWPERICIDAILDAESKGAVALNRTSAAIGEMKDGLRIVTLTDTAGRSVEVKARRVLAMSGIWIDEVLQHSQPNVPRKIFGTKGAHIVIRLPAKFRRQGISTINSEGEPFYCIPWHDLHYIGPTETPYDGDPNDIRTEKQDLDFLLSETAQLFPGLNVTARDVVRTWAGVRPLTYDTAYPKGNRSRKLHDLAADGLPGVFAMTAAPIMSHRNAGREVVSILKRKLTPSIAPKAPDYSGTRPAENSNTAPIVAGLLEYHMADVRNAVKKEHATSLMDVLYRRTGLGLRHDFTDEELARVSDVMGQELDWSQAQREQEIRAFRQQTDRLFTLPAGRTLKIGTNADRLQQGDDQ
ncbi:MAG: FAD-dependent oxidoreductase [Gemmobacter sp.]|nr:FAD-dependent oxidoreductase [Gemmobacter sp.]